VDVAFWRKREKSSSTRTGRARPVTRAGEQDETSGPDVDDELPLTAREREVSGRVAAVARVSAGAHQPEGARRGGKEAAEVACADRDEGASEAQAPEEDLARQVETRHAARPRRGRRVLGGKHLKVLQDTRTGGGEGLSRHALRASP